MYRTSIQDERVLKQRASRRAKWRRHRQEREKKKERFLHVDETDEEKEHEDMETVQRNTDFRGRDLNELDDSDRDTELRRRSKQFWSSKPRTRHSRRNSFLNDVATVQAPAPRLVQRHQVTRNVRKVETDGIVSIKVDGYDFSKRLYTIRLLMANAESESISECKMKLSWSKHVQRALRKVKKKACATAFNRFMIDVDHSFSFAPKFRSFKEFVAGRMSKANHRSILLVGTVLTYIVSEAQSEDNPSYRVCILLLQELFGIFN